jgi:hypothetical protein
MAKFVPDLYEFYYREKACDFLAGQVENGPQ